MSDTWSRLWSEVFGQPPPVTGDAELMARILIQSLPYAPPYQPRPPSPAVAAAPDSDRPEPSRS